MFFLFFLKRNKIKKRELRLYYLVSNETKALIEVSKASCIIKIQKLTYIIQH